jgi:Rieske Fe-S protein
MDPEPDDSTASPTRRSLLRGSAAAGLALPLLSACASDLSQQSSRQHGPGRGPLLSASKVPVGGGKILADQQIVVTQPDKGDYKAFSAVCTHMQCLVTTVQNGLIICPCHGSEFSIKDGSVVRGPAGTPLPPVRIHVAHGEVLPG